jgi:mannose-6-phosphate isomerase-like protein (cupin superfamily)
MQDFHVGLAKALDALPESGDKRWATVFAHGSLEVEIYAPRRIDRQQPHRRDEVYVVAQGSGDFVCRDQRVGFTAGDLLFAAAGVPHHFENFSDDFCTWVLFYGPEGGK